MRYTFAVKKTSSVGDDYWLKFTRDGHNDSTPLQVHFAEPWQAARWFTDNEIVREGGRFMVIEEPHGRCMREYEVTREQPVPPPPPLKPRRVRS